LPWLNSPTDKNWISDKTRFCYDGFLLNRVTKYFFRKKNIFLPFVFFLFHILDPLFIKYTITSAGFLNLQKISRFKNMDASLVNYYFSFFKIINNFNLICSKYSSINDISNPINIFKKFLAKGFSKRFLHLTVLNFKKNYFLKFINNFIFK
jgi:hypothetical protein